MNIGWHFTMFKAVETKSNTKDKDTLDYACVWRQYDFYNILDLQLKKFSSAIKTVYKS